MQKGQLGWAVFRYLVGIGLLFFIGMLYWSSLLVEKDLQVVRTQLSSIDLSIKDVQGQLSRISDSKVSFQSNSSSPIGSKPSESLIRSKIDPNLPNLLHDDAYYSETLPKLLPANFKPQHTRQLADIGRPDNLHPFINLAPYTNYVSMCQLQLTAMEIGKYETMAPYLAVKMEERPVEGGKGVEYWVHLREGVYWQPLKQAHFAKGANLAPIFLQKHPVTAWDVKFFVDAVLNPFVQEGAAVALRNYLGEIEEVRVVDDLTLVVRWKNEEGGEVIEGKNKYAAKLLTGSLRPLPRFVYQYFQDGSKILEEDSDLDTYRNNSVWAQQFSRHWAKQVVVSCGPWLFDGMTEEALRFVRNPDHFNPLEVLVEAMEVHFKDSPDAIWQEFKVGHTDSYVVGPAKTLEVKNFLDSENYAEQKAAGLAINQLEYIDHAYFFIGWNEATPYFNERKVRQAMTMSIDRERIIEQNLNGKGVSITGTFALDSPAYDPSLIPWPFDPSEAKRLLEDEGWFDLDGDGVRDKMIDGKRVPFSFSLIYYVKNATAKSICESIATSLKEVGVECRPNGVDMADLGQAFENKDFDAIYFGWLLGTPPDEPKQLWHSSGAKEKGSSNSIGYANPEVDKIIEELVYLSSPKQRIELYHKFDAIIHEDQPYTFLFAPKNTLLYRNYVKNLFIPSDRQDLIPGANVSQPDLSLIWLAPKELEK